MQSPSFDFFLPLRRQNSTKRYEKAFHLHDGPYGPDVLPRAQPRQAIFSIEYR